MGKILHRALLLGGGLGFLVVGGACVDRLPVLSCLTDQTTVTEGDLIVVETISKNLDPDSLILDWSATRDIEFDMATLSSRKNTDQGRSAVFDTAGAPAGRYTIAVDATDGRNQASCSVAVTVEKNKQAPSLVCAPSNIRVTKGESMTIHLQAADPNNDRLAYEWRIDNLLFVNDRPSFVFRTADRSIGTRILRVRVTDTDRLYANCEFRVTIDPQTNEHPRVAFNLDKNEVNAGDPVTVVASASDPEGGPVIYSWRVDDRPLSDAGSRIEIDTTGLAGGKHTVTVTVRDDDDGATTRTESFLIVEEIITRASVVPPENPAAAGLDESRKDLSSMAILAPDSDSAGRDEAIENPGQPEADRVETGRGDEQRMDESPIQPGHADAPPPVAVNQTFRGSTDIQQVETELKEGVSPTGQSVSQKSARDLGTQETDWGIHTAWAQSQLAACRASDPTNDQSPCHEFLGRTLENVYSLTDFKAGGRYLRPILLAGYISTHADQWLAIGRADDQTALESAQSRANAGFPVIAVGPFHAALILPGRLAPSSSWQLNVPNSASFFPRSPSASYVGERLSQAWRKGDTLNVQLYYRVR